MAGNANPGEFFVCNFFIKPGNLYRRPFGGVFEVIKGSLIFSKMTGKTKRNRPYFLLCISNQPFSY
jgi:hypothetical protein